MKLLYSYTGPLIKDKKGNFYSRTITDEVLSRYLLIADDISICTRVKEVIKDDELKKYTKINSKKFHVIECPNLLTIKGLIFEQYKAKAIIKQAIMEADLIIIRLPDIIGNIIANLARCIYKPFLLEVVGCPWDSYWNHGLRGKIIAPFMWFTTKKIIKNASYAMYVTNEFLQHRYPCKGKIIGCTDVALPPLDDIILKRRINRIKSISDSKPIIIGTSAAVNVRYKGQQYVIKAISMLNKQGYNFEYHLIGGGDNHYLRTVAKRYDVFDKVKFIGLLPHDKVFEYLDSIDIYIHPSLAEGSPRAIIEALSRACPTLGSNVGGIPELFNKTFVFKRRSVDDICKLLIKINKKNMVEEAITNFNKAKEYEESLLITKKNTYLNMFSCHCSEF